MPSKKKPQPRMLFASPDGEIFDHPEYLLMIRRGEEFSLPRPDEIMPLPAESEFFMLPGRHAMGYSQESGQVEVMEELAVAAFACPGNTVTGIAAYESDEDAPILPLLSYAAIGYENGKFWVCAKKVDEDKRQVFDHIPPDRIEAGAHQLISEMPGNRLISHLAGCALTNGCPAAKNLALGRFECPLPTSQACNAECVGCISHQPEDSGFPSPQCRIAFRPTAKEIVEVMRRHESRERRPIFSFGQGCEGEPLLEAELICDAIKEYRSTGGTGTVNVNTNGSRHQAIPALKIAGVNSIRVSLNSARKGPYEAYYRPKNYSFDDVRETIAKAHDVGMHVSLNLLYFPGITDTEEEFDALVELGESCRYDFVQLRNLNLDPELYLKLMAPFGHSPSMGFMNFKKRLKKALPWIEYGYFNPYLG
ncbi:MULTISPECIES: radical SAM protein [unclassified Pseudodesulfovibrio]|uniref:radical SAM protein n=1 Tax=unclassified Pseudodesulfovibrio TaxID=2661612 RepID=UPI000FEB678C|nr:MULTISPECIES: radical SAM protein [unclassified Pseudodesulfovibrio]MCJ2164859.1 radical SAM protein [Pseudodesulfovibrio sp. S3-i]RWU03773.1 radical SAM protein [Pseudodesulfovibrio sp. S3]